MSPLQSTCLSHWFKDKLDSTKMRDLGCCAQDMKGKSRNGRFPDAYKILTMLLRCYGSWKLRRPGAHGKATKVIWKKTGPCDLGDSNGPRGVVRDGVSKKLIRCLLYLPYLLCSCLTAWRYWNLSPWHFLRPLTDWACKWSHSQVWQTGLSLTSGTWGISLKFKENCYLCMVK